MTETLCPTLFDRRVLPLAELLALCLDGQLYRVGDAFASADTPDTPALRAQALALTLPRRAIPERATAAWIHGTRSSPPANPQVCVDPSNRGSRLPAGIDGRQRKLGPSETAPVGPLRVTTPFRTAADLLLSNAAFDSAAAMEVRHLLHLAAADPGELVPYIPRTRRGGSVRVSRRLAAVEQARLPLARPDDFNRR
jgi:hypothetical protein